MLLEVNDLRAGYGDVTALFDVSIRVGEGEAVALVGSNGAGKTTLLQAISGIVKPQAGQIIWKGEDITNLPPHERVERGIVQIPQGRGILVSMTVEENLLMGTYIRRTRPKRRALLEEMLALFPRLQERLSQEAGTLSGGEQQMLAVARSLMLEPRLLIMDEPSLGLSPKLVGEVFRLIRTIKDKGVSILLIEQNLHQALNVAARGYVMETGHIVLEDTSENLQNNEAVRKAYLGI